MEIDQYRIHGLDKGARNVVYTATFGCYLFHDLFLQDLGGVASLPLPQDPLLWHILPGFYTETSLQDETKESRFLHTYVHTFVWTLDLTFRLWSRMKTESSYSTKPAPTGQDSSPNPKQGSPKLAFIEFWPQCLNQDNVSFEESNFERFEWVQSMTFAGHSFTWLLYMLDTTYFLNWK